MSLLDTVAISAKKAEPDLNCVILTNGSGDIHLTFSLWCCLEKIGSEITIKGANPT